MADVIIVVIVAVLLVFAARGSIRHFRGEGSCCQGGSSLPASKPRRLDGPVVGRRRLRIDGMHCQNCAERVRRALESIDGVSARVDWKAGIASVDMDRSVEDHELRKAAEGAGYKVVSVGHD